VAIPDFYTEYLIHESLFYVGRPLRVPGHQQLVKTGGQKTCPCSGIEKMLPACCGQVLIKSCHLFV